MTAGYAERREVATLRIVSPHGETTRALDRSELSFGRSEENDIRVDADVVSSVHARLVREGPTYRFIQLGETNPTFLRGAPIDNYLLHHGDRLEIAPGTPDGVTLVFELLLTLGGQTMAMTRPFKAGDQAMTAAVERLPLPASGRVTMGRAPGNDLTLPSLSVSRLHAELAVQNGAVRLSDAGSANGTYVNGALVRTRALSLGDVIRMGPYKLVYQGGVIEHCDDSRAVRLDAHDVRKVIGDKVILDNVSFSVLPGEVFAIAGVSGAGKSTLLYALTGLRPPTSGRILVNGADFYRTYEALRPLIGYVPQDGILPAQLGVQRALHYVSRLRLPPDLSAEEADRGVEEAMRQLDLYERRDVRIASLSGGQQKRANIAAELLADPGLFYLDEPTSGLDPGLTRRVTAIIRELATAGSTVVVISHDIESLGKADRILFLASGGRVAFIGSGEEALRFFDVDDLAEIYPRVEAEGPERWERRSEALAQFPEETASSEMRAAPQEEDEPAVISWDPIGLISLGARRGASSWRQISITTRRYLDQMLADRLRTALLVAQAPVIAVLLTFAAGSNAFQPPSQDAVELAAQFGIAATKLASTLPIMLAATAIWFGAINAAPEIVKELPMLIRERLAGLRVPPYLGSKFVVLLLLCLLQISMLLGIVSLKVDLPSSGPLVWGPLELWITLALTALAALGLGLAVSASVANADQAQSLIPIILIPQLLFIGGGAGIGQWLSYFMISHWSVEAMKITARIPYTTDAGGFSGADLALRWAALGGMTIVFLLFSAWQVSRRHST